MRKEFRGREQVLRLLRRSTATSSVAFCFSCCPPAARASGRGSRGSPAQTRRAPQRGASASPAARPPQANRSGGQTRGSAAPSCTKRSAGCESYSARRAGTCKTRPGAAQRPIACTFAHADGRSPFSLD